MGNSKGDRRERELVILYDDAGYAVMRAPASGGGTKRHLPDLLVGRRGDFYAIEAKASGGEPIYIPMEEVAALLYFAENFGAKARIAVRFDDKHGDPSYNNDDHAGWYFFDPHDLHRTPEGNYRIKKETALAEGERFETLVGA